MKSGRSYFADSTFLVDLMNGRNEAVKIIENSEVIASSSLCLYELGRKASFKTENIGGDRFKEFDRRDAEKAFHIHRELAEGGEKISSIDTMIAAQAINEGLELLIADSDFKKIDELDAVFYRD